MRRRKKPIKPRARAAAKASTLPISEELVPRSSTAIAARSRPAAAAERTYLTVEEIQRILDAITPATSRYPDRDRAALLLMFRHGLRVSELCNLELEDLDIAGGRLHVARLKRGFAAAHPIRPREVQMLRAWLRAREDWLARRDAESPYLFITERGGPLTRRGVHHLLARYAELAGISVRVHPHMLRHACGFALAEQGADAFVIRDYLGHRSVSTTNIYVASNPRRFDRLWR